MKCVKELSVPHYLHELVKKTVEVAMDGDEKRMELAKRLLKEGCARGIIPHHQLVLGIRRLEKDLPELMLDVPFAKKDMEEIVSFLLETGMMKEEELKLNWCVCEQAEQYRKGGLHLVFSLLAELVVSSLVHQTLQLIRVRQLPFNNLSHTHLQLHEPTLLHRRLVHQRRGLRKSLTLTHYTHTLQCSPPAPYP